MATLTQLNAESWWSREIVTDELAGLGAELRRRTGRPADAFGSKGNTSHLNGGHRSQEWILHSAFCTNHTYTVQASLQADQLRHIAACDWTPGEWGTPANRTLMVGVTRRLLTAMRAGELSGVREVIGTLDGKTVHAERYNGDLFSADSSHLDHVHVTFDRRRMHDAALMGRVADLITGDEMSAETERQIGDLHYAMFKGDPATRPEGSQSRDAKTVLSLVTEIKANLAALSGRDWVDEEQIADAVLAKMAVTLSPEAFAEAVMAVLPSNLAADVVAAMGAKLATPPAA